MWLGDFPEDFTTVICMFTTHSADGAPVAPSSALEAADVVIYKNGSATQKTSTNGVTMTSPFDSLTGLHCLSIDTSNDTGDVGFWAAGAVYTLVLSPDETVDSLTARKVIGQFGLGLSWAHGTRTLTALDEDSTTLDLDATIRAAVGLASANLDTQLTAIDDYLDTEVAAIKAKTDSLTFTVAGQVDANIQYVNDVQVNGVGTAGSPWGP